MNLSKERSSQKTPKMKDGEMNSRNSKNLLTESDQKRENFRLKGRGKSEILQDRKAKNLSIPTIQISKVVDVNFPPNEKSLQSGLSSINNNNYDEKRSQSKSPQFFVRTDNLKIQQDNFYSSFTDLTKKYNQKDTLSVQISEKNPNKMVGSLKSLDNNQNSSIDFKQQELIRRKRKKFSISVDDDDDDFNRNDDDFLDENYYDFLKKVEFLRKVINHREFDFINKRADKQNIETDWLKMVKNLRFKIHYNHYPTNIRFNYNEQLRITMEDFRGENHPSVSGNSSQDDE